MATLSLDRLELRLRELAEPWTTYRTGQAMAYALLGGGKRLRPRLRQENQNLETREGVSEVSRKAQTQES